MKEVCSCGASFAFTRPSGGWEQEHYERVYEMVKDWRQNHRCSGNPDTPQASEYDDMPTIVESSSSHERAMPFGFAPEPEGGW